MGGAWPSSASSTSPAGRTPKPSAWAWPPSCCRSGSPTKWPIPCATPPPTSASDMRRLIRGGGRQLRLLDHRQPGVAAELLLNEGLAVHASQAVVPGLDPADYFGYPRRQYQRMRELEAFLRRAVASRSRSIRSRAPAQVPLGRDEPHGPPQPRPGARRSAADTTWATEWRSHWSRAWYRRGTPGPSRSFRRGRMNRWGFDTA